MRRHKKENSINKRGLADVPLLSGVLFFEFLVLNKKKHGGKRGTTYEKKIKKN